MLHPPRAADPKAGSALHLLPNKPAAHHYARRGRKKTVSPVSRVSSVSLRCGTMNAMDAWGKPTFWSAAATALFGLLSAAPAFRACSENLGRERPLTRLAEFILRPFAALRAVRSRRANGLATLSLGERVPEARGQVRGHSHASGCRKAAWATAPRKMNGRDPPGQGRPVRTGGNSTAGIQRESVFGRPCQPGKGRKRRKRVKDCLLRNEQHASH